MLRSGLGLFAGDTPHRLNEQGVQTVKAALQAVRDRNRPDLGCIAQCCRGLCQCGQGPRCRRGSNRRFSALGVLSMPLGHIVKGLMKKHDCYLIIIN